MPGMRHEGRGLCANCYRIAKRDGDLDTYPRLKASGGRSGGRPPGHLVEDFAFIVEQTGGERAPTRLGWSKRTRLRIADRLGVDIERLDKALRRARERPDLAA